MSVMLFSANSITARLRKREVYTILYNWWTAPASTQFFIKWVNRASLSTILYKMVDRTSLYTILYKMVDRANLYTIIYKIVDRASLKTILYRGCHKNAIQPFVPSHRYGYLRYRYRSKGLKMNTYL